MVLRPGVAGSLRYSITNRSTHIIRIAKPKLEIADHPGNLFLLQQTDSTAKRIFLTDASGRFAMFKKMMETIRHPIVIRPHRHIRRQVMISLAHSTAEVGASRIYLLFDCRMMLYPAAGVHDQTYFTGMLISDGVWAVVSRKLLHHFSAGVCWP